MSLSIIKLDDSKIQCKLINDDRGIKLRLGAIDYEIFMLNGHFKIVDGNPIFAPRFYYSYPVDGENRKAIFDTIEEAIADVKTRIMEDAMERIKTYADFQE